MPDVKLTFRQAAYYWTGWVLFMPAAYAVLALAPLISRFRKPTGLKRLAGT
jgi:hypothetical protein